MLSNMILKFSSQYGSGCSGEGGKVDGRKTSSSETIGIEGGGGDPGSVINGEGGSGSI